MRRAIVVSGVLVLALSGWGAGEWQKPAASTTCADWREKVTERQQLDMAGPLFYDAVAAQGGDTSALTDEVLTEENLAKVADMVDQACAKAPSVADVPTALDQFITTSVDQIFENVGHELNGE